MTPTLEGFIDGNLFSLGITCVCSSLARLLVLDIGSVVERLPLRRFRIWYLYKQEQSDGGRLRWVGS